jgi:hypothetical protein
MVWGATVYVAAAAISALSRPPRPEPPKSPPRQMADPASPRGSALIRPAEDALRRMNNPAALGDCALVGHLPHTLKHLAGSDRALAHPTHALRTVLVRAIDSLKPGEGTGQPGEQTLYHAILHDEYVLGHSTARIMAQYAISESTFHRYRRDAIRAVAHELAIQEERLAASLSA